MSKVKINPNILKQETKFVPLFEKSLADKLDRTLMKNISDVYQAFANMDQNLYQVRTKGEELKDPSLAEFSNEIEKHQQIIKNIMTSSFQQMKDFLKVYREQAINSSKIIDQELKIEGKENLQDLSNDQDASQSLNLNEENSEIFQKEKKNNGDSDSNDTIFYDAYDAMILDEIEREIKRESLSSSPNDDLVENEDRVTLPSLKPDVKFSLIKILKDAVGKDLTKFWVPVYFNEPISMLQKVAEMMNNEKIIKEAANQTDPLKRLWFLAAFNVAMYGQTMNRISKPFNPMLGETFEMTGNGWKLLAEQVSHHPPISALYLSSNDFEIQMNTAMTTHFWGKSLEFKPKGVMHYTFNDNDDHYIVERPISACRNVIFGTMYIEHYGKMTIKNMRTGDEWVLEFHKAGKGLFGSAKNVGLVEGVVKDADGEIHYHLRGRWNETISMSPNTAKNNQFDEKNSTLLWQAETPPDNWERIYHFSRFTLQLNKITNEMKQTLPLTDSRRRTDQRALENGDLTLANNEKHRLEERQRAMRKYREQNYIEWVPSYFEKYTDSLTGLEEYRYINNYWEDKKQQNWSHLPDLFGYD